MWAPDGAPVIVTWRQPHTGRAGKGHRSRFVSVSYGHGRVQSSNAAFLSPACITSLEPSLSGRASCSEKASDMVAGRGFQHIWRVAARYLNKGMLHGKDKNCPHRHVCAR